MHLREQRWVAAIQHRLILKNIKNVMLFHTPVVVVNSQPLQMAEGEYCHSHSGDWAGGGMWRKMDKLKRYLVRDITRT